MLSKLVRYGVYASVGVTGAYSANAYRTNEHNSMGVVRFGRAAFAVNKFNIKNYKKFYYLDHLRLLG